MLWPTSSFSRQPPVLVTATWFRHKVAFFFRGLPYVGAWDCREVLGVPVRQAFFFSAWVTNPTRPLHRQTSALGVVLSPISRAIPPCWRCQSLLAAQTCQAFTTSCNPLEALSPTAFPRPASPSVPFTAAYWVDIGQLVSCFPAPLLKPGNWAHRALLCSIRASCSRYKPCYHGCLVPARETTCFFWRLSMSKSLSLQLLSA